MTRSAYTLNYSKSSDPWLICHEQDIFTRETSQTLLRPKGAASSPVALIASGTPNEIEHITRLGFQLLPELGEQYELRVNAPFAPVSDLHLMCWPTFCLHARIAVLLGAGGDNKVHETRASGTPQTSVLATSFHT